MNRNILGLALMAIAFPLLPTTGVAAQRSSSDARLAALGDLSQSFEALSERVSPAVVQILAVGYALSTERDAPGAGLLIRRRVTGSGVVLDPDGYIVTNAHVVEGADRIRVQFPVRVADGPPARSILRPRGRTVGAQIVNVDRETDLAVLRVVERGLPHLALGDSDELRKGHVVFAFGSPAGLENSVTLGVVSAVARHLRPDDPMIYIQTDAPINPGSSGGPLVDARGRVVGINTFILTQSGGSEGIGFAVPSNIVRNVFQQIKLTGRVERGEIGVHSQTLTPVLAEGLALPRDWGVVLGDVFPGSPAEQAGLRVGDVILTLDGKVMENGRQFDVNLYGRAPGDVVTLEVLRAADTLTVRVWVVGRPGDLDAYLSRKVTPEENLVPKLGVLAVDLDDGVRAFLPPLRGRAGAVVVARATDASSREGGLLRGDAIYSINGKPVAGVEQLRAAVASLGIGEPVVLQVERRGRLMYLGFEFE